MMLVDFQVDNWSVRHGQRQSVRKDVRIPGVSKYLKTHTGISKAKDAIIH